MSDGESSTDRFAFGANWSSYLGVLDPVRIKAADASIRRLLRLEGQHPLAGQRFLDIGSGSGLFSLVAVGLGAKVVSIDLDAASVRCTEQLRDRWLSRPDADRDRWAIHSMSILNRPAIASLGLFDVVYSWGVLHHTGQMDAAIDAAAGRVTSGGRLAMALYNDQGGASRRWLAIKRGYHRLPKWLRPVYVATIAGAYELKFAAARAAGGRNPLPLSDWASKRQDRGMSVWYDWVDWVGGMPFEVARVDDLHGRFFERGWTLESLKCVGSGWGCNEFVFRAPASNGNADHRFEPS